MSSGRLQMSMLSSLRVGETGVGVVPSGLIMTVRVAPLSTDISAHCCVSVRQPSCETSADLAMRLVCLTVISTCLLEVQTIVCGKILEPSVTKLYRQETFRGKVHTALIFHIHSETICLYIIVFRH